MQGEELQREQPKVLRERYASLIPINALLPIAWRGAGFGARSPENTVVSTRRTPRMRSPAGATLVEPKQARFAVGDFATWHAARETLRGLHSLGVPRNAVSVLGLRRHFQDQAGSQDAPPLHLLELACGQSPDVVCCTSGMLAERLSDAFAKGAATLGDAFSRWLPLPTAQRIQRSISEGVLLVWVQVLDGNDERRACTGLLALCASGVEVHDLLPLRASTGNGRDGAVTKGRH
jgi:hypothetical protein